MLDDMLNRTKLTSPHELFVHDLGACLTMEETVDGMLEKLVEEANDSELKQKLRHHREETQGQIRNCTAPSTRSARGPTRSRARRSRASRRRARRT